MSTLRTFIGYYHVTAAGAKGVITRPAITVPKTAAVGPSETLFTAAQIDTIITGILENNELFPIEELNNSFSTGFFEAVFNGVISDANTNNRRNAVKIGFVVPDSGPNAGYPCVSVMQKLGNNKITAISPIVDVPVPEEPEPEPDPLWEAPAAFTTEMWGIEAAAGKQATATLNALPGQGGTPIEDVVIQLMDAPTGGTRVGGQFSAPSLDLATPFNLDLTHEDYVVGTTYYAEIFAGNEFDYSPITHSKAITILA